MHLEIFQLFLSYLIWVMELQRLNPLAIKPGRLEILKIPTHHIVASSPKWGTKTKSTEKNQTGSKLAQLQTIIISNFGGLRQEIPSLPGFVATSPTFICSSSESNRFAACPSDRRRGAASLSAGEVCRRHTGGGRSSKGYRASDEHRWKGRKITVKWYQGVASLKPN